MLATLLERRDWHARLLNGSDYPLPGVLPLISLPLLAERRLLDPAAVAPLKEIRDHNVLLFDFVLKRSLASNGARFAHSVFETRCWFDGGLGARCGSTVAHPAASAASAISGTGR